jgi:hypothetical protein
MTRVHDTRRRRSPSDDEHRGFQGGTDRHDDDDKQRGTSRAVDTKVE